MSAIKILARVLASRIGPQIELAIEVQSGEILRVLATEDQVDRLVDELEDLLHSPAGPEDAGPSEAA